jgi:hypothetical protein
MLRPTLILAGIAVTAGLALAQPRGGSSYDVTYQSVADDCSGQGMSMSKGLVTLSQTGDRVTVNLAGAGSLTGSKNANGRFKAQGAGAPAGELEARLSVSGRAGADEIQLIFIAEFYRGKKPVCTQSWSGQGRRR